MLKTYTFYLRDSAGDVRFEPVLCRSDPEAIAQARRMLAERRELSEIEVCFGETRLFILSQATTP